ncbi:MAG TPA: succinate--CoA ligase subunit alpha [Methanomassiliicoccales archaeon]|nr:succinate--CoA ligase subunit alpha [Methanomassiliicoccales archaeon]
MTVLIDAETKVLVQGITGHQGSFHAVSMRGMGTNVVGGTSPGRGGSKVSGIPVFDTVEAAVRDTGANASVVFVPAKGALGAVVEALDAGISTVVVITEHIPEHDAVLMIQYAKLTGARIVGPNCPGIAAPRHGKLGIMPSAIFRPGNVGVVSRSGTLTYEIVNALTSAGIGQSTCVGIGGDPVVGTDFVRMLEFFEQDEETEAVVLVGEIGGAAEEDASEFIKRSMGKPVIAYIAGRTAPPEKRMGHAGAIIARGRGTAENKIAALNEAGVEVAALPKDVPELLRATRS